MKSSNVCTPIHDEAALDAACITDCAEETTNDDAEEDSMP